MIPFIEDDLVDLYPFAIKDGKFYQLVDNEEEIWELHVSDI